MIRLALLLVGAHAVRRHWMLLPVLGVAWIILGLALIIDASSGRLQTTIDALAVVIIAEGAIGLIGAFAMGFRKNTALAWRATALIFIGLMVLDVFFDHGISDSVLFGLAFLIDGTLRMVSAVVLRFERWRFAAFAAVVELVLAALILASWPLPYRYTIPLCLGIALIASGWSLIRLGLQVRNLRPGASITELPMYAARAWATRPELAPEHVPDFGPHPPMTLYVWTPRGSANDPQRRLLIDRYIAAVDGKGVISTGHSALELLPDVYISHYPGIEIDHSPTDFTHLLRAGHENDIPGRWIPSHAFEVASWCEPDARVDFDRYDAVALRSFWSTYRADNTYNLTSRSCSTVTSLAIESALEGIAGHRRPWAWFFFLLTDPNLWLAALLRRRGATMAWTPGLVLDYARALHSVVERQEQRWFSRLYGAIAGYQRSHARPAA